MLAKYRVEYKAEIPILLAFTLLLFSAIVLASPAPPTVNSLNLNPSTAYTNTNLNCTFNITDSDGDNVTVNITFWRYNGTAWLSIYKDSVINATQNQTINITLPHNYTHHNETWKCQLEASDGTESMEQNSTNLTILEYPTSLSISNSSSPYTNTQVYFYANYTHSMDFGVPGLNETIGRIIWTNTTVGPYTGKGINFFDYEGSGKRNYI